jgi:hypothetical protein
MDLDYDDDYDEPDYDPYLDDPDHYREPSEPDWDAVEYYRLSEMSPFGRALYEVRELIWRHTWRLKINARRWRSGPSDAFSDEPPF